MFLILLLNFVNHACSTDDDIPESLLTAANSSAGMIAFGFVNSKREAELIEVLSYI